MKSKLYLFLLLIVPFFVQCQQKTFDEKLSGLLEGSVPIIKINEAKKLIESGNNILLFDTRSKKEFEVSALKNAQLIDYETFSKSAINMPDLQDTIILYCTMGYRSEKIGEQFKKLGYKNIYNLYGGIFGWVNDGQAVYKDNQKETDSIHTYNKDWSKWLEKGIKVYE